MSRIEELEKRLAADPNSRIFVQLAEEYRKQGLLENAIEVCESGLEKHPQYPSARVALGRALLEAETYDRASEQFEAVLAQIPDNILANKFLGETYHRLGRYDEAIQKYQIAQTLAPEDAELEGKIESVRAEMAAGGPAPVASPEPADETAPADPSEYTSSPPPPPPADDAPLEPTLVDAQAAGMPSAPTPEPEPDAIPAEAAEQAPPADDLAPIPLVDVDGPMELETSSYTPPSEQGTAPPPEPVPVLPPSEPPPVPPAPPPMAPVDPAPGQEVTFEAPPTVEPAALEPPPMEPPPMEPAPMEPPPMEPAPMEPAPMEPAPMEPAPMEPPPPAPPPIDPAPAEPAVMNPLETEPAALEPATFEPPPLEPTPAPPAPIQPPPVEPAAFEPPPPAPAPPLVDAAPLESETVFAEAAPIVDAEKASPPAPPAEASPAGEIETPTMAELYASQGHFDKAVTVYRNLLARDPNETQYIDRIEELEMLAKASADAAVTPPAAEPPSEAHVEPGRQRTIDVLEQWLDGIRRSRRA